MILEILILFKIISLTSFYLSEMENEVIYLSIDSKYIMNGKYLYDKISPIAEVDPDYFVVDFINDLEIIKDGIKSFLDKSDSKFTKYKDCVSLHSFSSPACE